MKKERTGVFLVLILVVAVFLSAPTGQFRLFLQNGSGLLAGRNVNMVSGQKLPWGDPFLQRQNEPSIAVSTRNPMHLLAGANDYRTVDMLIPYEELPGPPEGAAAGRDAWLGVYKSFNGGQDWQSGLLAGFPQDATAAGAASPLKAYGTAADPVVRAGTNGLFYMSGIAFNRNAQGGGLFIARFIDNNNKEKGDTIKYLGAAVLDKCTPGQFIDKPWLAVDLPRSGSIVNIDGQEIPAHNVYVAYTVFVGNTDVNVRSKVLLARSTNCGLSWGPAVKLSETQHINQGVTIAVDPRNNGVLYVAWRRFAHGADPDAIIVCRSADGGQTFTKPVVITTLTSFDQGSTAISFRTNSYPSLAVDHNGLVYAAWSQRLEGNPLGMAKVVMSASSDGATWSTPTMVDGNSPGHQVMPSLTYAMGRVICVWYDQRWDKSGRTTTQWIDDTPGMERHTLDVRAAEISLGTTSIARPTIQVSRYLWIIPAHSDTPVQAQWSRPNYPLFKEGTRAFYGDYIDLTPSPMFIPTQDGGWAYNTVTGQTPVFHAAWTDNRDVRPPEDNDWSHYTPPASDQDPAFQSGVGCEVGRTSLRNQNVYTASLTGGLVVGSPGNHKSLGPNPYNQAIKHTFVVYVKNLTAVKRSFRLTIEAPTGVSASFLQGSDCPSLDVWVAPASSIARTVFASSTSNPDATIRVLVKEISGPGGGEVSGGLNGSVILNPDIENPDIENPDIENPAIENPNIENYEVHNPDIENPAIENPDIENPDIENRDIGNPDIENADIVNPDIENLYIENPDIENKDVMNPDIENPDIENPDIENGSLSDYTWHVKNIGNTASSYKFRMIAAGFQATDYPGFGFQLLIYRVYTSPVAANCLLKQEHHDELLANIGGPDIINPDIENPDIENPDIENFSLKNATFWLAPGDEAYLTLRVYDPNKSDSIKFDPEAMHVAGVATAQSVNSEDEILNHMVPPVSSPLSSPVIYNPSLPNGVVGTPYTAYLVALYGKPPYTWTIVSGALPAGLSLVANTGAITGTPTTAGESALTFQVSDSNNPAKIDTKSLTIRIGAFPYFADGNISPGAVYCYDPATQSETSIYTRPAGYLHSFLFAPWDTNQLYFVNANAYNIYKTSLPGGQEEVFYTHGTYVRDIAVKDGFLYFSESTGSTADGKIWRLDGGTPTLFYEVKLSQVNGSWAGNFTFDKTGVLYLSNGNEANASIYRVNIATNTVTKLFTDPEAKMGLAFGADGFLYYANWGKKIYRLDLATMTKFAVYTGPTHVWLSDVGFK